MLGHVAQSVGNALPGNGALNGVLGQLFTQSTSQNITAPADTSYAFIEAIGRGGNATGAAGNPNFGAGGGAGNDAILPVAPGQILTAKSALAATAGSAVASTIELDGVTVLTAAGAANNNAQPVMQSGASGKYPGFAGVAGPSGLGKGGGRLAGPVQPAQGYRDAYVIGAGAVQGSVATVVYGGGGAVCITFFASYEAALSYAKAAYGGTWTP